MNYNSAKQYLTTQQAAHMGRVSQQVQAIKRLAEKLDVLELARMVGIKDLKILMVYYNKTAEQLADKL